MPEPGLVATAVTTSLSARRRPLERTVRPYTSACVPAVTRIDPFTAPRRFVRHVATRRVASHTLTMAWRRNPAPCTPKEDPAMTLVGESRIHSPVDRATILVCDPASRDLVTENFATMARAPAATLMRACPTRACEGTRTRTAQSPRRPTRKRPTRARPRETVPRLPAGRPDPVNWTTEPGAAWAGTATKAAGERLTADSATAAAGTPADATMRPRRSQRSATRERRNATAKGLDLHAISPIRCQRLAAPLFDALIGRPHLEAERLDRRSSQP